MQTAQCAQTMSKQYLSQATVLQCMQHICKGKTNTHIEKKKLQVAHDNTFRILLKLPTYTSSSQMFAASIVPTFHAVSVKMELC